MSEFYFEGLDLKNITSKIGCPSGAIEKNNFMVSQGNYINMKNKVSKPKMEIAPQLQSSSWPVLVDGSPLNDGNFL